jgi:hypothetical protein
MRRLVLVLALLASLLPGATAQGAYDPLGSGTTKLTIDRGFASFLAHNEIKLTVSQGAKRKGSAFTLPVTSGNLDPTIGKGEIDNEGTIAFEAKGRKVPLRQITVKTKSSPLIAKVGGGQLKLATSSKLSSKRDGFGTSFQAKQLKLTAKLATRLNKKLRPKVPFTEGQIAGSLVSKARPQLITVLPKNRATLVFEAAFVAKLESRFVSLNPIFPAEHLGATFTFPIATGGTIAPDGSAGTLRSEGAVELLQLAGGQVFWHELWLDLGAKSDSAEVDIEPTPAFPGKLGRVGVFDLGAIAISPDPTARSVSIAGAQLTLQAQSAASLNQAFAGGEEAFKAGEAVGTLSFAAQGQ